MIEINVLKTTDNREKRQKWIKMVLKKDKNKIKWDLEARDSESCVSKKICNFIF